MTTKDLSPRRPQRTCLGCRTIRNKNELIRVVRTPEGNVEIDLRGRANGRGAYLCRSSECLKKAVKSGALARSLKTEIPDEVFARLAEEIDHE